MASSSLGSFRPPTAARITGITVEIEERLERTLLINLKLDDPEVCSVQLERKQMHCGIHSFEKPLYIHEQSVVLIQVQEKHRLRRDKTFTRLSLTLEIIWRGRDQGTQDGHDMRYQIHLNNPRNKIWLNVDPLFAAPESEPQDIGQSPYFTGAFKSHSSHNTQEELRELKDYLLDGIKLVDPRATECISGTRTAILADVASKTDDKDGTNVLWIRGAPGSGKSSLSLTAKSQLRSQGRLITYFRFDRNEASTTTSSALWRCVAYDLGRRLPSIRTQLLQQLRDDKVDLDSSIAIFTSLVEGPLSNPNDPQIGHPLIIVIDAIDECGGLEGRSSSDRKALLHALGRWPKLPKCFRLLVTSRDDGDILRVLSSISTHVEIPSGHSLAENRHAKATIDASNDIRIFLEARFQDIRRRFPSLPSDWPGGVVMDSMVSRAAGIFMWATTAVNFVDSGIDQKGRLRKLMQNVSESTSMKPLYSLYTVILEMAFGAIPSDQPEAEILRSVLSTIVLANRPLGDTEFTKLPTTAPVTEDMLNSVRECLLSVLSPGPLRFVHKSFDDFLLSDECPSKYRIRMDESQYMLIDLCLTTMAAELRFNMCSLETSCLRNVDVPNIEIKVGEGISGLLSYSCCFWANHLNLAPFDNWLMTRVRDITKDKLLYWFEAMSLLRAVNRVPPSLLSILKWSGPSPDDEFKDFVRDAHRFIGEFGQPISQSAPHIYISALPFAPEYSSVATSFLSLFPNILRLSTGRSTDWSPCIFASEYHSKIVNCVAFSPNEKYFVSGSYDDTVCVCDSETGNLVSGPLHVPALHQVFFGPDDQHVWASSLEGHAVCLDIETGAICAVVDTRNDGFDPFPRFYLHPNGGIVSVSDRHGTVTLWSSDTGERVRDLLEIPPCGDHISRSWASFSLDGTYLAFATRRDLNTIEIWNLVDGSEIRGSPHSQPQIDHTKAISALSFAVDSYFLASGSQDGTIVIWNAETGDVVGRPLVASKGAISAVAYSRRRSLLVSATHRTVMVWNTSTYEVISGPLEGHTSLIWALALSPNGEKALSASEDGSVRMWDLRRNGPLATTHMMESHTESLACVAFSPCGKMLLSLGGKDQIRAWDPSNGELLLEYLVASPAYYSRVTVSPDGRHIVAFGSINDADHLGVWDSKTGAPILLHQEFDEGTKGDWVSISHIAFRSTDQQLVTGSCNGVLRIWNLEDNVDVKMRVEASYLLKNIITLSPDGLTAFVRYSDNSAITRHHMWNTISYQTLSFNTLDEQELSKIHIYFILQGAFSPNGRLLAAIGREFPWESGTPTKITLRIWDARNGHLVAGPSILQGEPGLVLFSPNDCHIAVAFTTPLNFRQNCRTGIQIWNGFTGSPATGICQRHPVEVGALAFSPDGELLASGTQDGQIKIWNTAELFGGSERPFGFLGVGKEMRDGWVTDGDGRLLFWVPMDRRSRLAWPGDGMTIGGNGIATELDLIKFRYGEHWIECFRD